MKRLTYFRKAQTAGFTLIEVLVVVIIAAVLAGIAAPSWLAYLNRQRVNAVQSDLLQTLKQAQQEAIQRRESVAFVVTNDAVPTVTINGVANQLGSNTRNPGNVQLYSFYAGGTNDDADAVTFNYRGLPEIPDNASGDKELPFVISINAEGSSAKQCVIVASLIGTIKTADGDVCDDPVVTP
jgi:prepilin-type N-terminal cleavage/methylation domain-containing protein